MDIKSLDEIIADIEDRTKSDDKKGNSSSNNDDDERFIRLDHPKKVEIDKYDR